MFLLMTYRKVIYLQLKFFVNVLENTANTMHVLFTNFDLNPMTYQTL